MAPGSRGRSRPGVTARQGPQVPGSSGRMHISPQAQSIAPWHEPAGQSASVQQYGAATFSMQRFTMHVVAVGHSAVVMQHPADRHDTDRSIVPAGQAQAPLSQTPSTLSGAAQCVAHSGPGPSHTALLPPEPPPPPTPLLPAPPSAPPLPPVPPAPPPAVPPGPWGGAVPSSPNEHAARSRETTGSRANRRFTKASS